MIARTIPKIIPPTNEAASNFLPLSAGVGRFKGSSVTVDGGGVEVVVVAVDEVVVGFDVVGDILAIFVAIETGDGVSVSLDTTETTKQI